MSDFQPGEPIRIAANAQGEGGIEVRAYSAIAVSVDLWYPPMPPDPPMHLIIGLMHVRAADEIRISYDFVRDGWKIEQASCFVWEYDDRVCDPDWQEVAFVQAWGREDKERTKRITGEE